MDSKDIYEVRIPDTNAHKKKLFEFVDHNRDKIVHIDPVLDTDGQRRYVYATPEAAKRLFSDPANIPPEEIIHSIKFRDYFSLERFPETHTIYCKTDFLFNHQFHRWFSHLHWPPSKRMVLITGSADYTIDDAIVRQFKKPYITHWFGTNVTSTLPNVQGIPLGIASYDPREVSPSFLFKFGDTSEYHQILSRDASFQEVCQMPILNDHKIYMNFSKDTYHDRVRIWNEFVNHPCVYSGTHTITSEGRMAYLKELRASEYSLCARGNGVDTYRFWESLYTGTTPIVEHSRLNDFFQGLPFIIWPKMTVSALDAPDALTLPPTDPYPYHKLYVSYWIEQIERASVAATLLSA
jgi:hypothetical protein